MNPPFNATGKWCLAEGRCSNGVMIVGEAPGEEEAQDGLPFRPRAQSGSVLERAILKLGLSRDQFVVTNAVPMRPPNNWLEGAPWEVEAIQWGRPYLEDDIKRFQPKAIVALGNTALRVLTGMSGPKQGVSHLTGYVLPSLYGVPVIPCFHPSYLRRGFMSLFGVLLRTLRLALQVARSNSLPVEPPVSGPPKGYHLAPSEGDAGEFYYACKHCAEYIAYDIETPYSTDEEEAEEHEGAIKSIQFSISAGSGYFFPFDGPYRDIAQSILALPVPKLSWNGWKFDRPRLEANGIKIAGEDHDLMWAWHHLQPDLPRGLQFAAGQLGWPWPWKHLDHVSPEFYGIVDVDVLQWMVQ